MTFDVANVPHFLTDSTVVTAGVGALLLLFGRRLYFLLLGVLGFVGGLWLSTSPPVEALGLEASPGARLAIAVALGVVSAVLAFAIHRVALGVAGLAAGGFGGFWLAQSIAGGPDGWSWLLPIGGAIAGGVLLPGIYKAALVGLSAWVGSALLVQMLPVSGPSAVLVALGLLAFGILFQAGGARRSGEREREDRRERKERREERRQARRRRKAETAPVT
jgi:hypothetical protein